jgi:hypothetical protein
MPGSSQRRMRLVVRLPVWCCLMVGAVWHRA